MDEVGGESVRYYQHLLGSSKSIIPVDVSVVQSWRCLGESAHSLLLAPVTKDDIKSSLFSIGNDKAPGPNSFPSLFLKKSWGIIGGDYCSAIQDFFFSGELLKQVNHSIISLVPKSENISTPSDFRPISCCNVIYKVISKILAGRLALAIHDIISPAQNAFLSGRSMTDNVYLVQELLIRHYNRKRASPRCLIKIDFRKAFDSVQWPFLRQLLLLLNFPARFVQLIMRCVETASFSVAVNGDLYGFFPAKSGVRQGDLLSPYLFIVCTEYFSRMPNLASHHPDFRFHPKCGSLGIQHLACADDVLLLCRGDRPSVNVLQQQLLLFGRTSGLLINAEKPSIFFDGVDESSKLAILQETGFSAVCFPFRYLGVPRSPHRLLASQFSPLLHKLESAMVQFWLNIFPLPSLVIHQITCLCRNFLWTGSIL
jgi:hypothetical protein